MNFAACMRTVKSGMDANCTQYGVVRTVRGGERLERVAPGDWSPVNLRGEVLWISAKAVATHAVS